MPPPPTGLAAAIAACGHSPAAWAIVVAQCAGAMYPLALRMCGQPHLAEDAVQDALLLIRDHGGHFRPRGDDPDRDAWCWVRRITANAALQLWRSRERARAREQRVAAEAAAAVLPRDELDIRERDELVRAALSTMGELQRTVLVMHAVDGLTHEQCAVELGMPLGTVKGHLRRGMARMRGQLARHQIVLPLVLLPLRDHPQHPPQFIDRCLQSHRLAHHSLATLPAALGGSLALGTTLVSLSLLALVSVGVLTAETTATAPAPGTAPASLPAPIPASSSPAPAMAATPPGAGPAASSGADATLVSPRTSMHILEGTLASIAVHDQPIGDVLADLERQYGFHVLLRPEALRTRRISLRCDVVMLMLMLGRLAQAGDGTLARDPDSGYWAITLGATVHRHMAVAPPPVGLHIDAASDASSVTLPEGVVPWHAYVNSSGTWRDDGLMRVYEQNGQLVFALALEDDRWSGSGSSTSDANADTLTLGEGPPPDPGAQCPGLEHDR